MDDEALHNLRRQQGKAREAAEVAVGEALVGGEIGERGDFAPLQHLPPARCPVDGAQEAGILTGGRCGLDLLGWQNARAAEMRGVKAAIFGASGAGKTTLLRTLKAGTTLFFDVEAGDLAVEGLAIDTIRPRT